MSEYQVLCTNPACGKKLRVPESALGRRIRCPACKQEIRAPGTVAELAALAAQERFRFHVVKGPAFAGTEIELDPDRLYTVGRADTCTVQLPGPTVSRRHFSLYWVNGHWVLEDLNTTTGTLVNGLTIINKQLNGGELIEIGAYQLKVIAPGKRVDSEQGPAPVVLPAGDAAPLPLSQDAGVAAPQKEEERLAQQRLVEALSFTDYSPEHLSEVSATEHRAYTLGLVLKLGGLIAVAAGLIFGVAWFGKQALGWYGDASSRRPRLADSTSAAQQPPTQPLPRDFLAALEARDFELAQKLLESGTQEAALLKPMKARLQSDLSAYRADLLRQAHAAVRAEDWKEVERLLIVSESEVLEIPAADWKPIQDALALQQTLTAAREAIAQRQWEDAARRLDTANALAPNDPRIRALARVLTEAVGAGLRINIANAVDGAVLTLNGRPVTPGEEIWELAPGQAELVAAAPGFIRYSQQLTLEPGRLLAVDVKLLPTPPAPLWALRSLQRAHLAEPLWVAALHYGDTDAVDDAIATRFAKEAARDLTREPGRTTLRVARVTLKTGESFTARIWTDSSGRLGINRLPAGDSEVINTDDVRTNQEMELAEAAREVFQGVQAARLAGLSPLETLKLIAKFRVDLGVSNQTLATQITRQMVAECLRAVEQSCGCCAGSTRVACATCDGSGFIVQAVQCDRCKGTLKMACMECSGRGSTVCKTCGGRGSVEDTVRNTGPCGNCGGTGRVRQYGGTYTKCQRCGGTGRVSFNSPVMKRCSACDGKGSIACQRCRSSGKVDCAKCKSTGHVEERARCPDCDKGTIVCDCCQGVGTREAMEEARRRAFELQVAQEAED